MANTSNLSETPSPWPAPFVTTHWSVVLAAGHNDTAHTGSPLAQLCEAYWYPLYSFVRRRGYTAVDAQDLTQEFFARLLAGHWLEQADRKRGRFRSFLLGAMKHFLANEWNKSVTQKRGGRVVLVSLNDDTAETRYAREPATSETPEKLFERRWALTLLESIMMRLEGEYGQEGKADLFAGLKSTLTVNRNTIVYPALASTLGIKEGAARVAVFRLRRRYRQLLRAEIANTVASPDEVDEEMRYLFKVLTEG